ncbi:MAG: MFS transporter [Caldilineaceae bacterium]
MPQFRLYAHGQPQTALPFTEFVALMASMTALVALSIDAMLPALAEIANDLGAQRANDSQLVISLIFLGLAIGQIFYGPLSDSIGRKPAIYLGFALFSVGCLLGLFAVDFRMMLIGRFLQGFGVAGPRGVSIALVRDQYEGRAMARYVLCDDGLYSRADCGAHVGPGARARRSLAGNLCAYLLLVLIIGGWFRYVSRKPWSSAAHAFSPGPDPGRLS